jgi:hypothetical protein
MPQISHSRDKCKINNLERFPLNKIIIPSCTMLFTKECCHATTLVFLLYHCTLKFCLKNSHIYTRGYHLVYMRRVTRKIGLLNLHAKILEANQLDPTHLTHDLV